MPLKNLHHTWWHFPTKNMARSVSLIFIGNKSKMNRPAQTLPKKKYDKSLKQITQKSL
jgi:hypothetical protein